MWGMSEVASGIVQTSIVLGAVVASGAALRKIWKACKSVLTTTRRAYDTLHFIAEEFGPNGGSTMRDAVEDVLVRLEPIEQRLGLEPNPTKRVKPARMPRLVAECDARGDADASS